MLGMSFHLLDVNSIPNVRLGPRKWLRLCHRSWFITILLERDTGVRWQCLVVLPRFRYGYILKANALIGEFLSPSFLLPSLTWDCHGFIHYIQCFNDYHPERSPVELRVNKNPTHLQTSFYHNRIRHWRFASIVTVSFDCSTPLAPTEIR